MEFWQRFTTIAVVLLLAAAATGTDLALVVS